MRAPIAPVTEADAIDVGADALELDDLGEQLVVEQHRDGSCGEVVHRHGGLLGSVT